MNAALEREARRLLDRYLQEVVERFDLCPWAEPARARGEMRVSIVDAHEAAAALDGFAADETAVLTMVVLPRFDGDASALRRLRDELLAGARGGQMALADFHPEAELDTGAAARLVPWLRRAPDPMLQAVRHQTLASLRRPPITLSPAEQAAALAGTAAAPRPDPGDKIAAANLATVRAQGGAIAAVFDDIARDRAASYAALALNTGR